jgi:hypothetical protein
MVILRATSILEGQKEDKWMMCSITQYWPEEMLRITLLFFFYLPKINVVFEIIIKFMINYY